MKVTLKLNLLLPIIIYLIIIPLVFADTKVGLTYQEIVGDIGVGLTTNTKHDINENVNFEIDITGAKTDGVRGRWTAELTFYDYYRIYQAGLATGPKLTNLGFNSDIGFALHLPILNDSGVGIGIVNRNGGEFARESLSDFGERNGYAPQPSVEDIYPNPTGLSIRPGQSFNILVYTDFELKQVDIGIRVLPQLTGENKAHNVLITGKTDIQLKDNYELQLGLDVGLQHYQDIVEYETASNIAIVINF